MRVTLRLPDDLGNTIRWQAWEGRRSFNSEVVSWLEAYLESHPAASGVPEKHPKPEARAALGSQEPTPAPTAPVLHVPVKGRSHDPANCRLYGCGLCQAAGINDGRRGL